MIIKQLTIGLQKDRQSLERCVRTGCRNDPVFRAWNLGFGTKRALIDTKWDWMETIRVDTERLYELLADEIVMQWITPRWDLPATYELGYRIEELLKFLIDP